MTSYPFRRALITGASAGIGEQFAHLLGNAGVPCVLVARRTERLAQIASRYPGFEVLSADLFQQLGIDAVNARITQDESPVDLVINNAGFGSSGPFVDTEVERATGQVDLNIRALVDISHAALGAFRRRGGGHLLNVSSVASFQAGPNLAVYSATKAFVTSFTEAIHEEMRGSNIRISALCPGFVKTEFQAVSGGEDRMTRVPSFMWLKADKVAEAGLDGVAKGQCLVIPGAQYKGMTVSSRLTPRFVLRRVAGMLT